MTKFLVIMAVKVGKYHDNSCTVVKSSGSYLLRFMYIYISICYAKFQGCRSSFAPFGSLWGLLLAGDSCSKTEIRPSTKRWKWGELSLDVGEIVLS